MHIIRNFKDIDALVKRALLPERGSLGRASRDGSRSYEWDRGIGFEGAVRLAKEGWPEGAQKVKEVLDLVANILKPQTHEVQAVYQDSGGAYIDVGRFVTGEPECFGVFIPPDNPRKPIKVAVSSSASAGVHGESLVKRGAAVVAAIDVLETQGYMVECDVTDTVRRSYARYTANIRVKEMGQPVDLDRLGFCLIHPGFMRRLIFAIQETEAPELRQKFGFKTYGSYGTPDDWTPPDVELYFHKTYLGEGSNFATPLSSAKWVHKRLVDAGLIDEEDIGG